MPATVDSIFITARSLLVESECALDLARSYGSSAKRWIDKFPKYARTSRSILQMPHPRHPSKEGSMHNSTREPFYNLSYRAHIVRVRPRGRGERRHIRSHISPNEAREVPQALVGSIFEGG